MIAIKLPIIFAIGLIHFVDAAAQEVCMPLVRAYPDAGRYEQGFSHIDQAGRYCLTQNAHQSYNLVWGHAGFVNYAPATPFVSIWRSGVELDLQGFVISSVAKSNSFLRASRHYLDQVRSPESLKNIAIRNGRVELDKSLGMSLISSNTCTDKLPNGYCQSNFLIQNLDLCAMDSAVKMLGAGNQIVGSRLQSKFRDGEAYQSINRGDSINNTLLYGPNNVIENSILIYDGIAHDEQSTVIRLVDADNTIIRNNIIIVRGGSKRPKQAISIVNSKNVILENNRVYGAEMLYKLFDQKSDVQETGNSLNSLSQQPSLEATARRASDVK